MSALYNLIMDKSTYVWMVRKMNIPTINMCIELNLKKLKDPIDAAKLKKIEKFKSSKLDLTVCVD